MNLQTEQLLGTLEILCRNPFIWENSTENNFSLWNLMISQGFVNLTDIELAFVHWQNIEEWGTPTEQGKYGGYAPTRSERKNDYWDENIAKERKKYYQQLLQIITDNLQNIQAYNLSIPKTSHINFEFGSTLR